MRFFASLGQAGIVAACLIGASAAWAQPAPAPASTAPAVSAGTKTLREIGRVRARSVFCSQVIGHADDAIQTALGNDTRMAFTISNLRTIDMDGSPVKKANGTHQLLGEYTQLRAAAVAGEGQVKLLRADADAATDPDQKAELKRFADALAGALERQKKMADRISRYVAYADAHAALDENAQAQYLFDIQWAQSLPGTPFYGNPQDWVPPSLTDVAHTTAEQLSVEQTGVDADEGTAATRVEPAFKTCL